VKERVATFTNYGSFTTLELIAPIEFRSVVVRGLLVAVAMALVVLVGAPAAAAQSDYPPGPPGIGVPGRPAPPGPDLPQTGTEIRHELALGAGLIAAGGTILIAVRRRRAPSS
jgi:LPXTG-motif cell wall-anchored protein